MKKLLTMLGLLLVLLLTTTCAMAEYHHTYDMVDVKMPSCESDGYYLLKNNSCGRTVKEITDGAWGHDWAYVTGQEADCTRMASNGTCAATAVRPTLRP